MMHPDTTLGWTDENLRIGVLATKPIPRGTIVWTTDDFDVVVPLTSFRRLPEVQRNVFEYFGMRDPDGAYRLNWDHSKWTNHSCNPAILTTGWLWDIAVRDIQPGEPVNCEYALFNLPISECRCGYERCRGRVNRDDLLKYGAEWDEKIRAALAEVLSVQQPLWEILRSGVQVEVEAAVVNPQLVPSSTTLLMKPGSTQHLRPDPRSKN